MYSQHEKQKSFGKICKIQGSLIIAEGMYGAKNYQIVTIGTNKILGEIVKLQGDQAFIQPFENSHGLQAGDLVSKTGQPLSAELGPGILGSLCDGIQRNIIPQQLGLIYLTKNLGLPALDGQKKWNFKPMNVKQGDILVRGDCFGSVQENHLTHKILLPPKSKGRVNYIAPEGDYNIHQQVLELELNGVKKKFSMSHKWPIREPRPFEQKLSFSQPFQTGYRILDGLFPMALGGTCAMPGGFTKGNALMTQNISVNSKSDVVIYVGCNQKGSEISEVIQNFEWLQTVNKKEKIRLMNKSLILANGCNMSIISREASIYTGATIAQYYRDMGLNSLLISDSISKWSEAFSQRSNLLSQMPGFSNFQSCLKSRLDQFYQRAGKVSCLGAPNRNGSVTILSTINSGKFSDFVTTSILDTVQSFWYIDRRLAQIKHFPEINWNQSYSQYQRELEMFYVNFDPQILKARSKIKQILRLYQKIHEKYGELDKNKLTQQEKLQVEVAKLVKQQFFQQNIFSQYDHTCSLEKTFGMIKSIATYFNLATQLVDSASPNTKTFEEVATKTKLVLHKLMQAKFYEPTENRQGTIKYYQELQNEIKQIFAKISDE